MESTQDSGAIRTEINAVLTVHRVVFRNHDGQMGGVFDEGSATFHSSTFYDNAATHVWARSSTTFWDCVFGAVSTYVDVETMMSAEYGVLAVEDNAEILLFSCAFDGATNTAVHMPSSAAVYVYCAWLSGITADYQWGDAGAVTDSGTTPMCDGAPPLMPTISASAAAPDPTPRPCEHLAAFVR